MKQPRWYVYTGEGRRQFGTLTRWDQGPRGVELDPNERALLNPDEVAVYCAAVHPDRAAELVPVDGAVTLVPAPKRDRRPAPTVARPEGVSAPDQIESPALPAEK